MAIHHKVLHAIEHGHYWLIGGFWALGGLACLVNIFSDSDWWRQPAWIKASVGLPYLIVSLGFLLERRWARWCMIPLLIAASLACLDGWLCGAWCGNHELVHFCVAGFAVTLYSVWFICWSLASLFLTRSVDD